MLLVTWKKYASLEKVVITSGYKLIYNHKLLSLRDLWYILITIKNQDNEVFNGLPHGCINSVQEGGWQMNIRRLVICLVMLVCITGVTACSQKTSEEADMVRKDGNIVSKPVAGSGQVAEGWIDDAVKFWENNI